VSWRPAGASSRELSEFHGVTTGGAISRAPASVSRAVADSVSSTSNANRMWPATRSHLHPIDVGGVERVGQLEGGAACIQDRDPPTLGGERAELCKPEHVAIEGERLVVVVRGDHEAHLSNRHAKPPGQMTKSRPRSGTGLWMCRQSGAT